MLEDVVCRFDARRVLDGVSLDIAPGEFLVVLGASGCGKTTLLRAIAGFHRPAEGVVRLGQRMVSAPSRFVPPEDRGIGIVFQSYALWPHMTVAGNVGFGLGHIGPIERRQRVARALAQVGLAAMAGRRPAELSGGQRQRVALARCLAKAPGIVLMDEPLANLDPALRGAMQREFAAMRRELASTFVYVTHDQAEALALADRIALMEAGRILQCAAPQAIWERPESAGVARFLGCLLIEAVVLSAPAGGCCRTAVGSSEIIARCRPTQDPGPARLAVRPHDLALADDAPLSATVLDGRYQGSHWLVRVAPHLENVMELEIAHRGEPPAAGARVGLSVLDGWVVPDR